MVKGVKSEMVTEGLKGKGSEGEWEGRVVRVKGVRGTEG